VSPNVSGSEEPSVGREPVFPTFFGGFWALKMMGFWMGVCATYYIWNICLFVCDHYRKITSLKNVKKFPNLDLGERDPDMSFLGMSGS